MQHPSCVHHSPTTPISLNKRLPFHSFYSHCILTHFPLFPLCFPLFPPFIRFVPFTKNDRSIRLSFASAPLCRINQSSNEKQQSTSYKRQQTTQLNSIKQSVTKDNRRSSSPCRRLAHCLSCMALVHQPCRTARIMSVMCYSIASTHPESR